MAIPVGAEGPHMLAPYAAPHNFDRSGPGAALAAINATIRMSVASDADWSDVVSTLLAPGAARDAFVVNRVRVRITGPAQNPPHVCGYRMLTYTPHTSRVAIIARQSDQSLTANTATVVWSAGGDWQLQLPDPTSTTPIVATLGALPTDMVALKGQC